MIYAPQLTHAALQRGLSAIGELLVLFLVLSSNHPIRILKLKTDIVSKQISQFIHSARKTLSLGAAAVSDQIDAFGIVLVAGPCVSYKGKI